MMMEVYKISKKRLYTKTLKHSNTGNADKRYCKKSKADRNPDPKEDGSYFNGAIS